MHCHILIILIFSITLYYLLSFLTLNLETKAAELETRNRELENEACAEREVRTVRTVRMYVH